MRPMIVITIPSAIAFKLSWNSSIMHVINPKTGNNGKRFIFIGILNGLLKSGDVYLKMITEAFMKIKLKKSA